VCSSDLKLINESVIRRWGKLANMQPLTENFIDTLEEEEEETVAEEEEMDMDMEMDAEPAGDEASMEEKEAVESIVQAVVDAISAETGVDIEVEGDADGEEMDMDMEMDDDDAAMGDEDPAMRDAAMRDEPMNRDDELEEAKKKEDEEEDDAAMRDDKEMKKEELDLEVIDDEALTEAVLRRVVERLLKKD